MPAAENTNNFWNLGGEKRGLSDLIPPGAPGILSADCREGGWCLPNLAYCDFGVFWQPAAPRPATVGRRV